MNLEDYVANKTHWLCIAEVLARDIFMSQPVSGLFPCRGISKSCYLSCLVLFFFFLSFLSAAETPIKSDPCYFGNIPKPFFFPVNTNLEPVSQHSMSFVCSLKSSEYRLIQFSSPFSILVCFILTSLIEGL